MYVIVNAEGRAVWRGTSRFTAIRLAPFFRGTACVEMFGEMVPLTVSA